jgi:hypothetical protein
MLRRTPRFIPGPSLTNGIALPGHLSHHTRENQLLLGISASPQSRHPADMVSPPLSHGSRLILARSWRITLRPDILNDAFPFYPAVPNYLPTQQLLTIVEIPRTVSRIGRTFRPGADPISANGEYRLSCLMRCRKTDQPIFVQLALASLAPESAMCCHHSGSFLRRPRQHGIPSRSPNSMLQGGAD